MSSDNFDFLEDVEHVTSDADDTIENGVESTEGDAYRDKRRIDGANLRDAAEESSVDEDDGGIEDDDPYFAVCR